MLDAEAEPTNFQTTLNARLCPAEPGDPIDRARALEQRYSLTWALADVNERVRLLEEALHNLETRCSSIPSNNQALPKAVVRGTP